MTDNALIELVARCEAAEGPDRYLDAMIADALQLAPAWVFQQNPNFPWTWSGSRGEYWDAPAFTASLDAAMTLVPKGWWIQHLGDRLDGWAVRIETNGPPARSLPEGVKFTACATPALALCAAALRARAAMTDAP